MLKNRIKHFVGRFPTIFFYFYKIFGPPKNRKLLFDDATEIVIEGFPRSANTFAVVSFEQAQSTPVKVAHHLHVEAQLAAAAKRGIPAVAILRKPEDSFRSLLIRHPGTPINWAMQRYIYFYTMVKKLGDGCLIVEYDDVITDMGLVVDKINQHFNTSFSSPKHNDEMVNTAFKAIEGYNKKSNDGKESHIARPSNERKKIAKDINFIDHEEKLHLATKLYESLKPVI